MTKKKKLKQMVVLELFRMPDGSHWMEFKTKKDDFVHIKLESKFSGDRKLEAVVLKWAKEQFELEDKLELLKDQAAELQELIKKPCPTLETQPKGGE